MHSGDSEFAIRSYSSQHIRVVVLDERISIYGLQSHSGVPNELMNARKMCAIRDNTSLNFPMTG